MTSRLTQPRTIVLHKPKKIFGSFLVNEKSTTPYSDATKVRRVHFYFLSNRNIIMRLESSDLTSLINYCSNLSQMNEFFQGFLDKSISTRNLKLMIFFSSFAAFRLMLPPPVTNVSITFRRVMTEKKSRGP